MEIIPSVFQFKIPIPNNPLGYTNVYFVKTPEGNLLIDSGWNTDEAFYSLQHQMKAAGGKWEDLRYAVVTHCHPDHCGLHSRIAEIAQPELVVSAAEIEWLRDMERTYAEPEKSSQNMFDWVLAHGFDQLPRRDEGDYRSHATLYAAGELPEHIVGDGDTLQLGDFSFEVVLTPGHSVGHICLYEKNNRILFCGDHILRSITPNISAFTPIENPLGQYLVSLEKVSHLQVHLGMPAHGLMMTRVDHRIEELLEHHEIRANAILSAMEESPKNALQLSSAIRWTEAKLKFSQLAEFVKPMAVGETVAHLDYLVNLGRVKQYGNNGQISYSLTS